MPTASVVIVNDRHIDLLLDALSALALRAPARREEVIEFLTTHELLDSAAEEPTGEEDR